VSSFRQFQREHGRVKVGSGYQAYDMQGRPALILATQWLDEILASGRQDCRIKIKGGAQWGKTVWAVNLMAYLLGCRFMGCGYYLPDNDLVSGIVDTKFRPDVIDQIPWFARMLQIGKTVNKSGKSVNRKGAVMCTDGKRVSLGYFLGMSRVPTSYTHDVQIVDERDDVPEKTEKFLDGRLTSSDVRLRIDIGTARYDAAGMAKEFEDGTQHCAFIQCDGIGCMADISPEDEWPHIVRLQRGTEPQPSDPMLTLAGDFKANGETGETVATHAPNNIYYFACPKCGAALNRNAVQFKARRPEMEAAGKYSIEVSQISTPAIQLTQIVAAWASAVQDPDKMIAFRCDRWARPKSATQGVDSAVIQRSEQDYALSVVPHGTPRFGGVDTGDRFWFFAREVESPLNKRVAWAEQISPTHAQERIPQLFAACGLSCLFIDIGNERELARRIVMAINGLLTAPPVREDRRKGRIDFGHGLSWNGETGEWRGLKAACVEFSGKPGSGIVHELRTTQEGMAFPVIRANRDETIQRAIDELLTYDDGLLQVMDGKIRTEPAMHMPSSKPGCSAAVETVGKHIISGSRKVAGSDGKTLSFIDKVENHYLLADAYSALSETVAFGIAAPPCHAEAVDALTGSEGGYEGEDSAARTRGMFQ
jgi:hypothetical protein